MHSVPRPEWMSDEVARELVSVYHSALAELSPEYADDPAAERDVANHVADNHMVSAQYERVEEASAWLVASA